MCSLLIPRGLLALMIPPFKIISLQRETDVGQPFVFVRIVEVLVNYASTLLFVQNVGHLKVSLQENIKCSHDYLLMAT